MLRAGTYRIERFIGSGGFGCTYEARHVLLDKRVAIKEFFEKENCNRDSATGHVSVGTESMRAKVEKDKEKFVREARFLSQMSHRGIVRVSDVFEENGTAYYVMDYIEGCSLRDIVAREGRLPEWRAVRYMLQVCQALEYVHSLNRLHLDIKPGNIMIDRKDNALLIDFGTTKQYDAESGEGTSTLLGFTDGYAPPEQTTSDVRRFDPVLDIYALGATLYNMLTGETPPAANMRASGSAELKPLVGVSDGVRSAVEKAMKLNKKERPQTVAAFAAMLTDRSTTDTPKPHTPPTGGAESPTGQGGRGGEATRRIKEEEPQKNSGGATGKAVAIMVAVLAACAIVAPLLFGNAEWQNNQGEKYYYGDGVEQDYDKAAEWYRKAAKRGYAEAQNSLGYCYQCGLGVEQDYDKAVEWYRKAAEQDFAPGQNSLGYCYQCGLGVEQDYDKAVEWYRKAAEQGLDDAQNNLGLCYDEGLGVEQDYTKAVEWYSKAAAQDFGAAQNNLGVSYCVGQGVEQDYDMAVELFLKAAIQDYAQAQINLGHCYDEGLGVEQDYTKAVEWYSKAAAQGDADAQFILSSCYYYGHGVEQDYDKAVEWCRKAAAQGNEAAIESLRNMGMS